MLVFLIFWQNSGKLEKAEILEMTVQYLRALHSADFPRGREKGESASHRAPKLYASPQLISVNTLCDHFHNVD